MKSPFDVVPAALPAEQVREFEPVQAADRQVVERKQLRHPVSYMIGIGRRCRHGYPQAFLCAPLRLRGTYVAAESATVWLSCPLLVEAIDQLEKEGWIERLEELARKDDAFRRSLERLHGEIVQLRLRLLPDEWLERLNNDPSLSRQRWILFCTGLAGVTRPEQVKCLHAHLADYLSRGTNPVGRIVAGELARRGIPIDGTDDCWRRCSLEESA